MAKRRTTQATFWRCPKCRQLIRGFMGRKPSSAIRTHVKTHWPDDDPGHIKMRDTTIQEGWVEKREE